MKFNKTILGICLIAIFIGLTGLVVAEWEHEEDDDDRGHFRRWLGGSKPVIEKVESPLYQAECGSCHIAYQPGLLPAQSWQQMMANLEDHFGENAELPVEESSKILNYLLTNAAERVKYGLPRRISTSLGGNPAPLRITQTRFFLHEHEEIPGKMVLNNEQVRSLSNCDACHTKANEGSFREHEVRIPGYGRWDD
ncbi:MAG: diheme cytochrome c [Pseudomonadota bacterium]